MKKIIADTADVRKWYSTDFLAMQDVATACESALGSLGDFIVSGCVVSSTGVTGGVVMLGGKMCSFAGAGTTEVVYVKKVVARGKEVYKNGAQLDAWESYTAVITTADDALAVRLDTLPLLSQMIETTGANKYVPKTGNSTIAGVLTVQNIIIS